MFGAFAGAFQPVAEYLSAQLPDRLQNPPGVLLRNPPYNLLLALVAEALQ